MNLTALTLLQGRLFDIACESGARLQRLRQGSELERVVGSDEPEWRDVAHRSQSAMVDFFERRLSTALNALERIDEGRFGWCERCGHQMDGVQMFVHPERSTCGACDPIRPVGKRRVFRPD